MKYILLLAILLTSIFGKATVVLIQSNATPVIGISYTGFLADTTIQEGPSGSSVAWVFNNLNIETPYTSNCIDPSSTPYFSSFPSANVSLDDSGTIQFIRSSVNEIQILGRASTAGVMNFNTPISYFTFPFTYNSVTSNININGTFPMGTVLANYTSTGDAFGSLTVNGHTINDVLRVKIEEDFSYYYTGIGTYNEHTVDYAWFDGINPLPIFEIITTNISGMFSQRVKQVHVNPILTSTDDLSSEKPSFSIFPNPSHDLIEIHSFNHERINAVKIYNSLGNVVTEFYANRIDVDQTIDITNLSEGFYFIELVADKKNIVKLVVE